MTLGEKQKIFARLVGLLIQFACSKGYELTFGEAFRSPEEAKRLAKLGKGIVNSLHCQRLAIDLNLFKDGKYLSNSEDYVPLGVFWEILGEGEIRTVWGGRFKRPDGNHFSLVHDGRG